IKWLDARAAEQGKSRASVLRDAIASFREREGKAGIERFFGLWERHGSNVDGLEYERELRGEWPDAANLVPPKKRHDAA
ncbi:MAG: hypothetical protein ACKOVA_11540, partial [Novosphingobium sp.]